MKTLKQSKFKVMPAWVNTLAINSNGTLWAYETNKPDLECNDVRWWCPIHDRASLCVGYGYDIVGWKKSAIKRKR